MKAFLFILISLIIYFNNALAKEGETPSTSLTSNDLISFIEKERSFLRGKFKVDLVQEFIGKSSVQNIRFGNKKNVLNLKGISLSGKNLRNSIFNMANMSNSNLSGANLQGSDFVHVDFTSADLTNTDFRGADLSNALFENTKLDGANFEGANLFDASFIKVSISDRKLLKKLKRRSKSYINLPREPLPEYYK